MWSDLPLAVQAIVCFLIVGILCLAPFVWLCLNAPVEEK